MNTGIEGSFETEPKYRDGTCNKIFRTKKKQKSYETDEGIGSAPARRSSPSLRARPRPWKISPGIDFSHLVLQKGCITSERIAGIDVRCCFGSPPYILLEVQQTLVVFIVTEILYLFPPLKVRKRRKIRVIPTNAEHHTPRQIGEGSKITIGLFVHYLV